MTIKFEDMEPDVKQSALRVIEQQLSRLAIKQSGSEEPAKAVVSTVKAAYLSLYEEDAHIEVKVKSPANGDHDPSQLLHGNLLLSTHVTVPSKGEIDEISEKVAIQMTGIKINAQSTAEYMKKVVAEVASRIRVDVNGFSAGLR